MVHGDAPYCPGCCLIHVHGKAAKLVGFSKFCLGAALLFSMTKDIVTLEDPTGLNMLGNLRVNGDPLQDRTTQLLTKVSVSRGRSPNGVLEKSSEL